MKIFSAKTWSLLSLSLLFSCKPRPAFTTVDNGKSLLWEVSGNGLKTPSYLYGTMHLMCAEDAVLSKNLLKVIEYTDLIYFEVDMDNAGELLGGLVEYGMKNNGTLKDHVSGEEYARVRSFFEHLQPAIPFDALERQHPLMLSGSLYELFLPCEKKNGTEIKIVEEAYRLKKETRGLETVAFQSSIFDSIPYHEQASDLVKTIDNIDQFKTTMGEMIAVYKNQDLEKLYELTMQDESGVSNHLDLLLYSRNRNWVQQLGLIAPKQSTLFAVGAGHLGGDSGLLDLLKKEGYTTRAIQN